MNIGISCKLMKAQGVHEGLLGKAKGKASGMKLIGEFGVQGSG